MVQTYQQAQSAIAQAQPIAFVGGSNLLNGDKGPKALILPCDFSATGIPATGYNIDITPLFQKKYFIGVQTLFIDNSLNNGYVTVKNANFNQSFSLPGGWQGYFPVLTSNMSSGSFQVTSTGNQMANIGLLNVIMPSSQWAATVTPTTVGAPQSVSDAILDATVVANRQNVTSLIAQASYVDRSGTIASGGVSQLLMAANPARQGFLIENIDSANSESLWICPTGAAAVISGAGSFAMGASSNVAYPGGSFQGVGSNAIYIIAATTGHHFSAVEW